MDQDRIIERIRKLLRLSQSANPHEAALAAERVQQMLSEYNLTMDAKSSGKVGVCPCLKDGTGF